MTEETFKDIFNKWGTYQSLQKDCMIIRYFMNNLDKKIRQKTIIKHFSSMHPKTVRQHLYRLVEKNIIFEDKNFQGTYYMPSEPSLELHGFIDDMNKLVKALVGKPIYDMAISDLKKDYEKKIDKLEKELYEYREELRQYR